MEHAKLIELITREVIAQLNEHSFPSGMTKAKLVPVAVSMRHVHLAQPEIDILFGIGHRLTKLRELYQPGEFAAEEVVTLVGPKLRSIPNVRVLGPVRKRTQVEVSRTDAIILGIDAPVRPSGQLAGVETITLVGPKGSITLPESCIVANRHIHISPLEAQQWGLTDNDLVTVKVLSDKTTIFGDVQVRVGDTFKLIMHIDTDDANAADVRCGTMVEIADKEGQGCL